MSGLRVRFCPAPTGYLHVGSARSALFNWLYARGRDGAMILRIEDTDTDRSNQDLVSAIYSNLEWIGIDWDEEFRQSERFDLYRDAIEGFLASGLAYYCECDQEQVAIRNKEAGRPQGYDGFCREKNLASGPGRVVRFRTPDDGVTGWDDVIRGRVEFENQHLEDFVILRSSGVPMFHVANAFDDLDTNVTHVIRGEDLVNTVPRVLLLREALGASSHPIYAHLPLIVNEKRQKLSKRRDDVSLDDYRQKGYLPEAMANYLATLGWGPGEDEEIMDVTELIKRFDINDVVKSPAFFDTKKLDHFNAVYMHQMEVGTFVEKTVDLISPEHKARYLKLAPLVQERVKFFSEAPHMVGWVFGDRPEPNPKDWRKVMSKPGVTDVLRLVIERMDSIEWNSDAIGELVLGVGDELGIKSQLPVRMALTGARFGIPLFEPMALMDVELVRERLVQALDLMDDVATEDS